MAVEASRHTDMCVGHDNCPNTTVTTHAKKTYIGGLLAARIGDECDIHGCDIHTPHVRHISEGYSKVIIEGKEAAFNGSAIDWGGAVVQGHNKTFYKAKG